MSKIKLILIAVGAGIALIWAMFMDSDEGIKKADESINRSKKKIKEIKKGVKNEKKLNSVRGSRLTDRANRTRRR